MSTSQDPIATDDAAMEDLVHSIPVVLPLVGAALIFLLAFIAVNLA